MGPWENLSIDLKRKRVLREQDGRCLSCGINEWMGKRIVIELDHVDGDHGNESRENLRGLCPNCHSQTPTWKVRNKRGSAGREPAFEASDLGSSPGPRTE